MATVLRKFALIPYVDYMRNHVGVVNAASKLSPGDPPDAFTPNSGSLNVDSSGCNGAVYVEALQPPSDSDVSGEITTPGKDLAPVKQITQSSEGEPPPPPPATTAKAPAPSESRDDHATAKAAAPVESRDDHTTDQVQAPDTLRDSEGEAEEAASGVISEKARVASSGSSESERSTPVTNIRKSSRKKVKKRDPDSIYWLTG